MKSNKILNKIAVIILSVLALVGIGFSTSRVVKNFSNTKDINAKTGDYTAVQWGEERVTGTNFVTFDAYFLKNGNKYRGEYLPYTKKGDYGYNAASKDLWVELRVLGNGSLRNAKLLFTQDNITEKFKLLESATIANDVIGVNANQVKLKEIQNGTTVLFKVEVAANLKNFLSNENKVKLVGEHVANDGTVTPIEKEVKFTVESSVDNAIAYITKDYHKGDVIYNEKSLVRRDDKIVIDHFFNVNFGNYYNTHKSQLYVEKFTVKEGIVEADLENFNGNYPSSVEVSFNSLSSSDYSVDYDSSTGKLKIRVLNVKKINSIYDSLKITTLYPENGMDYNREYRFRLTAKAHTIVDNNTSYENPIVSKEVEAVSVAGYAHTPPPVARPRVNRYYGHIVPPNKDNPISRYEGEIPDQDFEDWSVTWGLSIDNKDGEKEVVIKSASDRDYFSGYNDQNKFELDDYVIIKGIKFYSFNKLNDNSKIDLYDDDTGRLIHTFNREEIEKYTKEEFKLEPNVKHVKYVINNINCYIDSIYSQAFSIKHNKTINDKRLHESMDREAFNKLILINSKYDVKSGDINNIVTLSAYYSETARATVRYTPYYNHYDANTGNRSVSKTGAVRVYNGNDEIEDTYASRWLIEARARRESNLQIVASSGEKFSEGNVYSNSTINENYIKYHGIKFLSSPKHLLGEDGWIKVYNNDTNELMAAFNSSNWDNYINKPFIYEKDFVNIKVLTSRLLNAGSLLVENVMKIEDKEVKDNISKEQFEKLKYINKHLEYSSKLTANSSDFTAKGISEISVNYYRLNSLLKEDGNVILSTYKPREASFNISLDTLAPQDALNLNNWKNSIVLMEFPKDVVDISNISLNGTRVNIAGYEIFDKDGKKFLKAYLKSDEPVQQQRIVFNSIMTVNALANTHNTNIKVYIYNEDNDKYFYENKEIINTNESFVEKPESKDIYDINGNGNKEEPVGYLEIPTSIVAPQELHVNQKIINYNTDGDVVNAPNVGTIDENGTGKATVVVQLKNNFPPSITNIKVHGVVPYKNNKSGLSGSDLNSKINTFMTGPIKLPENLKNNVRVYYTEKEEVDRNWSADSNAWKTEDQVNDWSKIKNYYIDYGETVFNVNELTEFSYELRVPNNAEYNKPSFASNGVNLNLNTADGKLNTELETNKVGIQFLKKFNLEIDAKKANTNKKLQGLIYSAKLDGEENSKTGISNNDGKVTINGLLVDKEYTLEKISTEDNYISNNSKIKFKVIESNGNMILQFIEGENKVVSSEVIQPTTSTSTKVKMNFEYISKYNMTLSKVDVATNDALKNVKYELYEGEQMRSTSRTDKNGNSTFKKLIPGVEYTLKETYADGYYLNEPVKFKVVNTDGNPTINILSGNGENLVINKTENDFDEASVKFTDIKAKRYSIDITKYIKGKNEKLPGAGFMVSGSDLISDKIAETDSNGHVVIDGLYEYKPGQSYNGEYTIEEIAPPDGYTRNSGKLKIKAQRNNAGVLEVTVIEDTLTRNINTGKDIALEAADTDNAVYKIGVEDVPLFTIIKTDAKTLKRLPKTKFAIYEVDDMGAESTAYDSKGNIVGKEEDIDGVKYRVVETDENGEYTKGLRPGQYKFVELSTVDKRYEISKTPIFVGVGEKLKPKYGWTKIKKEPENNVRRKEIIFDIDLQDNKLYAVKKTRTYDNIGRGYTDEKNWEYEIGSGDKYKYKYYYDYKYDDNVVVLRTDESKAVVLNIDTGEKIKEIELGEEENIFSSKMLYDRATRTITIFNDEYEKIKTFVLPNSVEDLSDFIVGTRNSKMEFSKINNKYYISFYGDYSYNVNYGVLVFEENGDFFKSYYGGKLINNKFIAYLSYEYNYGSISESSGRISINLKDLNDKTISKTELDMYKGMKQATPVIKENGDVCYEGNLNYYGNDSNGIDLNTYYKFGIIIPETEPQSEIEVKNNWKRYSIKGMPSYGGNITDVAQTDYSGKKLEDVEIYSDSKKDIKITPDTGFKIVRVTINNEEIPLKLNSDGSMDLPKFENVTEDKVIEAQFSNTISYVRVNHYKKDTNEKIADTEVLIGNYNANYATTPVIVEGYELERNVAGEFVKPTNATGTFTTDDIEVNYYYQPKQVDVITSYELENGTKIIPDSTQKVEYGKDYTTVPGVVDNKYELVTSPNNSNGKISSETPVTVRYIYKLKDAKVTVHHYIDGTTDRVPNNEGGVNEDQVINGRVDDAYNTAANTTIPENYKVVNTPANAAGTMTVDPIEVTYFYKLKDATIENSNFEKTSPQIVNNANQKFVYNIKYSGNVRDYIGKGVLEIVDTLPYKIDIDKSDLAGGEYDEEHKTIKWKILINNINSFDNNGNVEIIKTFGVVYKDLPIEEHTNIKNVANIKFNLKDVPEVVGVTNKEKEVETTTDGQFARRITVNKTWSDDNNANGKRPTSIKYILKGGNTPIEQVVTGNVTTNEDWSYTFENVPKYNDRNELINYALEEEPVVQDGFKFYKKSISGDMNDGFDVTNTFKIPTETISVKADKHWADNSNQAKKRPTSIILRLKNGAEIVEDKTLTGTGDDWTYIFTNVPKYNQLGNEVNYVLEELEVNTGDLKFYNKDVAGTYKTGFTVTNTFNVPDEKVNVTVTKNWDDNSNVNGKRPTSIKYVLNGGATPVEQVVTGNRTTDENWSYTFTNLPKYNELGNVINYVVEEQEASTNDFKFYTNKVIGDKDAGFTITNKFVVPEDKIQIQVTKRWEDNSNVNNRRPESIKFVIKQNNSEIKSKVLTGNRTTDENWSYTFDNLAKYDENGQEIDYVLEEQEVNADDMKFYTGTTSGNRKSGFVVTNKFTVPNETIKPRVTIEWEDNSNNKNKRPNDVKVVVKDNKGRIVKEGNVTGNPTDNSWTKEFEDVPKYDGNGKEIPYTVEVIPNNPNDLEFYVPSIKGDKDKGFVVTERFTVPGQTIDLNVVKKWSDNSNARQKRPESIKLVVKNGNDIVNEKVITGTGSEWTYTFKKLPKYNNDGEVINYTVDEQEVNEGDLLFYSKEVNNNVITNTMRLTGDGEVTDSKVEKTSTLEKITDANQEIPYSIKYTGKIDKYIGTAKVTIIDKLPFEIDEAKSDIGDGIYDSVNKTITFIENINGIDTYKDGVKEVNVIRNIKVVYKDLKITPEAKDVNNQVSVNIDLKDTNKKIDENGGKKIPTDLTSKVIVKYIVPGDNGKVSEDKVIEGKVGEEYHTTPPDNVDNDYELIKVDGDPDGIITQEPKTISYIYKKKNGKVIVKYIDKGSNKKLYDDEVIEGKIGDKANIKPKEVPYYNLVEEPKDIEITSKEQIVTYSYKKKIFNMEVYKTVKDGSIDGEQRTFKNGKFTKLDIPVKKVNNSKVKIRYSVKVKNTGEIKGSAIVAEYLPEYFEMLPEENPDWIFENGKILSKEVELNPSEEKELIVTLTWKNGRENFGNIVNKVEIDKTKNDAGFDETDSEEEKKGKDNKATVVLVVKTGLDINNVLRMAGVGITLTALVAAMGYTISRKVRE